MSKKLIAVAAAAALALTGLVASPASAGETYTFSVTPKGQITAALGNTTDAPLSINVPSQDALRYNVQTFGTGALTASALRLDIQAVATSSAVRIVATGGVRLVTDTAFATAAGKKTAAGVASLDLVSNNTDEGLVTVYAFTTSTEVGTVTVTNGGNTKVLYVKGNNLITYAYNINFSAPSTADVSGDIEVTGSITDAFGNKIEGQATNPFTGSGLFTPPTFFGAANALSDAPDDWTESATSKGTYTFSVTTKATAGQGAIGLTIAPVKVAAFGDPKSSQFLTFNTASLASQITALTAQVAALQATVAKRVTKKRYNTLARKWNAAFPSQKVALKK
jgi:hypothetical protein